jgi:hypothetical protein
MRKIHWIASFPKSGNTWVRMLLEGYMTGKVDINAEYGAVTADNIEPYYQSVSPYPLSDLKPTDILHLKGAALLYLRSSTVKTHCANTVVNDVRQIPASYTQSAIYIMRDPRDVAISFSGLLGESIDTTIDMMNNKNLVLLSENNVPQFLGTWTMHVKSWTTTNGFPVLIIKYEDLLEDTEKVFTSILEFWKKDIEKERLKKAINMASFEMLKAQEDLHGFRENMGKEKFFREGGSTWKKVLTKDQSKQIVNDHHDMMVEHGYV